MFFQTLSRTDKNYALFADSLFDVRVNGFAVELCFNPGEKFAFLLRDSQTLEGPLNVLRNFFPAAFRGGSGREIIPDFVEINCFQIFTGPVSRQRFLEKY